jgi:hypothetical protein
MGNEFKFKVVEIIGGPDRLELQLATEVAALGTSTEITLLPITICGDGPRYTAIFTYYDK